MADLILGV
ncbi:Protein of unknown function [Bacillus toyonensis]|nr:Protein of unknown function [Bacillus toyonensis]